MKQFIFLFCLFNLLSAGAQTLLIPLGQTEKIPSSSGSLWIEDKKILQGEPTQNSWLLRGLREGSTYVQSGTRLYRAHVIHPNKRKIWDSLSKEMKNYIGLSAEVKDGQLLIVGKIYRWQDWLNLAQFFKDQEVPYFFAAEIPDSIKEKAQAYFEERMSAAGISPMKIRFSQPPELKLSESQESFPKYENLLRNFGVLVEKDKSSIEMFPVVKLEMTILEINKSVKQKYGLSWPNNFSAQIYPNFSWNSFSAELDALEQKGQAKILASPNLLCRSGQEASFVVGGEFPIKVASRNSKQVLWKNYGISLKFKPRADSSGRMSISIESEVSSIDTSLMVDGVPSIKNHRVSSHFDLIRSELVALSGLIKDEQGHHSQGLPGLADLPILGPLFGSQDFQNNKTELVIFVRPSVLKFGDGEPGQGSLQHLQKNLEATHAE